MALRYTHTHAPTQTGQYSGHYRLLIVFISKERNCFNSHKILICQNTRKISYQLDTLWRVNACINRQRQVMLAFKPAIIYLRHFFSRLICTASHLIIVLVHFQKYLNKYYIVSIVSFSYYGFDYIEFRTTKSRTILDRQNKEK